MILVVLTVVSLSKCTTKRASSEGNEGVNITPGLGAYSTHGYPPSTGQKADYPSEYSIYFDPKEHNQGSVSSVSHATVSVVNEPVPVPVPHPYPVIFTRRIPIHIAEPVAVPVPRPVHVSENSRRKSSFLFFLFRLPFQYHSPSKSLVQSLIR